MSHTYKTRFGSLASYEKGRVEPIADDARNYAFSNCFEVAAKASPYEKVVFGQNQEYALEVLRAEGDSPWYTCGHDEFALCMDGTVDIHLYKLASGAAVPEAKNGAVLVAVLVEGAPVGQYMGWMRIKRGHQAMLPAGTAYQFRSTSAAVLVLQTCKGELSIERWASICQMQ